MLNMFPSVMKYVVREFLIFSVDQENRDKEEEEKYYEKLNHTS